MDLESKIELEKILKVFSKESLLMFPIYNPDRDGFDWECPQAMLK